MNRFFLSVMLVFHIIQNGNTQTCPFTINPNMPCAGETVNFTVTNPVLGSSYTWDLNGDGNIDKTGTSVIFVYPYNINNQTYNIKLFKDNSQCSQASITVKAGPQIIIGVVSGGTLVNDVISVCGTNINANFSINNKTENQSNFTMGYTVDWGDGSGIQNYTSSQFTTNTAITHTYTTLGYSTITIEGKYSNGCIMKSTYKVFRGGNPDIGIASIGNTSGLCAPTNLKFDITSYQNNPPGTVYTFYENDLLMPLTYTQSNLPNPFIYIHNFTTGSCGKETPDKTYQNAFSIKVVAKNPCGEKAANIQPITLSPKPQLEYMIDAPMKYCPGEIFSFMNTSTNINEYNSQTEKCDSLLANWNIKPGTENIDYSIVGGTIFNSNKLQVKFIKPGTYKVSMWLNPTPVCGPDTITKTITILEPPTAKLTTTLSNANGCAPLTVKFDNLSTGYQVSYNWTVSPSPGWQFIGGTNASSVKPEIIFNTPGTYTVTLTATNVCSTSTATTTIVVKAKPNVALTMPGPFCQNASLCFNTGNTTFDAGNGTISNYAWAFSGGSPSSSTAQFPCNINYSVTTATTFTVSVTATNECGTTTATTNFEVQVPPVLTMPPGKSFCENDADFQFVASPSGGTWSGQGVNAAGLFTPSAAGTGTKTLSYKYGVGVCESTGTVQVTVWPKPTVDAGNDLKDCVNNTVLNLTGNAPAGGTWSVAPAGVVVGNVFNPMASGAGMFTLTYNYTDNNGCKNSDTRKVTVAQLPTVTTSDLAVCYAVGLVSLPPANPAGGTWSGPGVTNGQFDPIDAGLGTHIVTYTYKDPSTGCTNTAISNITVSNPGTINAGMDISVCADAGGINLKTGITPIGGTWTTMSMGLTGDTFDPAQAGAGIHTLVYSVGSGNCKVTDSRIITVFALPIVDAGPTLMTCINETVLNLTGGTPAGGVWTSSGSGVVNGSVFNPKASGVGDFTVTYSFLDGNGCSASDQRIITVQALPVITLSEATYCYTAGLVNLPSPNPPNGTWTGTGVLGMQFDPIQAGVGTHVLTYTFKNLTTGCSNSANTNIYVINPAQVDAGADITVCRSADPFTLNAGVVPVGGSWSSTGNGLSGSTFDPEVAGPGTYTLTYSVGSNNCLVQDTRKITVLDLPNVVAGPNLSACIDVAALTLTATPTGGTWTGSSAVSGTSFNPLQAGPGNFPLTYTYTDQAGCAQTAQMSVTIFALPVVQTNDTTYCNTQGAVMLPFASPAGGTWMGTGIVNNMFDPIAAGGPNTYPAIYTYTNSNNCVNRDTIKITVINPQMVQAGPDTAFCVDVTSFDLGTAAAPVGGTWVSSGSSGLSGAMFNPNMAGPGTFTLTYKVGNGNCEVKDTRTIVVHALPQVSAGMDLSPCADSAVLVLNGTPTGGTWSGNSNLSGNNFPPKQAGPGNYNLTYTYKDTKGCVNKDDLTILVNPLPNVNAVDTTYCNTPGGVNLPSASPAGGTWSGQGITGNQFNPIGAGGVGVYPAVYKYTDPNNCINRDTSLITVINPATVNAGIDTAFCESVTSFDLSLGITPAGGSWTSTGTGVTGNVFNPAIAGPGIHTLTYAVGVGNCEVKDTRTIQVYALPMVDAGEDLEACASETQVQLNGTPLLGFWTSNPAASITGTTWNPKASGVGTYTFTYTFTDPRGCVNTDQLIATVHPLPVPLANDTTYCNTPGKVLLPFSTPTGGSWHGQGVSGLQFDPQGAGGVGVYPVVYTFTDLNSCTDSITIDIAVIDPPTIYAGVNDTICINTGTLQLTGFVPGTGGIWSGNGIVNNQTGLFDPLIAGGGQHPLVYTFGVGNCQVKDTTQINVIAVAIEAGANRVACLDDVPLQLTGFAPAGGVWTGAGITDPSGVFSTQVAAVGTHVLYYQYNDPILDCVFIDSISIIVRPMPESDFEKPNNSCIDVLIPFVNLSQNTFMPSWTFGDGANSTLANPSHTYTDTGTYKVTLITKNEFGCVDSISRNIFVTRPPTAAFSTEPDSGCAVLKVKFFNTSSGFETNYTWDFGDGQTSTQYDPGEISFQQGQGDTIYYIVLTAQNLCAVRTWTDSIKVFPWPLANFGTNVDTICTGETISFSNLTLGNPDSFEWDFGNGVTSVDTLPNPVQFFTDSTYKTYTIRLIATNFCGSDTATYPVIVKPVDVRAFFNIPNNTGCEPYTLDFTNFATLGATVSWEFGDGNTSATPNPTHTYTKDGLYKVVQRASSGCGYDSTIVWITVLPAPDVSFNHAPQVCRNDTLQFNNTSPTPLSGTIWDFGDGDSSLLYDPVHAWAQSGVFPVTLTGISAANGCPASTVGSVNVLTLPVIRFEPSQPDGCIPLKINFTNNSLNANYYNWNFGDGNTQIGSTVSHIYTVAGQYPVWLQGVDLNGCKNDTTLYYITAHPIPSPQFSIERDRLCGLPVTAQMVNETPDATSYAWNMGNNTTSVQNNPSVEYPQAGDYTIQLIATNTFACKDTVEQVFSAYAIPQAQFEWDPAEGCAPLEVQFDNLSLYSNLAKWLFSDQQTSAEYAPAHTFQAAGFYGAQLIASHRDVCFDTLDLKDIIWVKPSPYANFSFVENLTMPPSGEFQFTDLSVDAVQWDWDFGDMGTSDAQNPDHRYYYNGPKMVRLLVTSENECTDDTIQVVNPTFMKGLFIPNAFTPGLNVGDAALFKPKGVGLVSYEIEVYSPFGQLLWKSDKLDEGRPAEAWDGTYDGKLMPQDVYTWKVTRAVFDNGTLWPGNFDAGTGAGKKVGSVTLIR